MITQEQFKILLPLATAWAKEQEGVIFRDGVPLNELQMTDARTLGLSQPEKVRLLNVAAIPLPDDPLLKAAAQSIQLITPQTIGLTLRYGIFVRSDFWGNRSLIVHELVHALQYERLGGFVPYERLGGFVPFLQQYLYECNIIGYPTAPMEQEAITTTARLVG